MKLSKFVKRAKSESYCVVIHADDSGIWLGTRLALYNATELPYMEGKEQAADLQRQQGQALPCAACQRQLRQGGFFVDGHL